MRPTILWLTFWLLFAFWFIAFFFHLTGGLTTYALLVTAIAFFIKASRVTKRA
jgi:hypothetical protein